MALRGNRRRSSTPPDRRAPALAPYPPPRQPPPAAGTAPAISGRPSAIMPPINRVAMSPPRLSVPSRRSPCCTDAAPSAASLRMSRRNAETLHTPRPRPRLAGSPRHGKGPAGAGPHSQMSGAMPSASLRNFLTLAIAKPPDPVLVIASIASRTVGVSALEIAERLAAVRAPDVLLGVLVLIGYRASLRLGHLRPCSQFLHSIHLLSSHIRVFCSSWYSLP